ncbi:hypothetical protein A7985_07150 [Pseudoalteromonas luteoviolacea]|uniref:Uncharacterized protein n=1 Tax=Pseudoalteromonas luteoviolacea TaxID=43657 RepID=A0A1C0TWK6_9GAMM|nr:hypothetical protein [Pseudoalteromonas luteoviolacea]OCQ23712.1 hypothetical protein A7985_07150 [Pseudoalteromonas luteoviolacea]
MKIRIIAASLILACVTSSQAKAQDVLVELAEAPDNFAQISTPRCGYCPQLLEPEGDIAWTKSSHGATNASECYEFVKFKGDDETDCIVRYADYNTGAKLVDTTMTKWISMKYPNGLAAYTVRGKGLYLRMGSQACSRLLNAQDHVRVDL